MAGNIIDTMVLVLGLDASKFTQQQKDALDTLKKFQEEAVAQGKRVESQANQTFHTMSAFKREVLGTLAAFTSGAGAKEIINFITNLDASTGRLSKQLNVSTKELSAWQGVMTQVGGTAEDANSAIGGLSTVMNQFFLGMGANPQLLGVLNQLKIPLAIGGKQRTADEVLKDLSRGAQGMDPARASALLGGIPGMNQSMLNALLEGPESLERRLTKSRMIGGTTDDDARAAQQFQESVGLFSRSVQNLERILGNKFLPSITKFFDDLSDTLQGKAQGVVPGSPVDRLVSGDLSREGWKSWWKVPFRFGQAIQKWNAPGGASSVDEAGFISAFGPNSFGRQPGNMDRFLKGLSFLETDQRDVASSISSAKGFFQFNTATAADARKAGIPDPRFGSYDQQASSTERFIRTFHPAAAAAIESGDFAAAQSMLKGRWPSLPGGSQPQSASRYGVYGGMLAGAPSVAAGSGLGAGAGGDTTVTIGTIQVNAPHAKDAAGIATEIAPQLRRAIEAGSMNQGAI